MVETKPERRSERGTIDLDCLDCTSTYGALSSTIHILEIEGYPPVSSLSTEILRIIFYTFKAKEIDLSDYDDFPNDALDRTKCVALLARLQNFGYLGSAMDRSIQAVSARPTERSKDVYTATEVVEDALVRRSKGKHRYLIGEWVEVRDDSMKWKLAKIENTVNIRGDNAYETEVDHNLMESEVRWPEEGLTLIFGMGPWVWQRWACLRLENRLRFQEGHEDDFEALDILSYTKDLWEIWLADSRNKSFRDLYARVGEAGQQELLDHILTPFDLIDEVVSNSDGKWNFDDADISIYTYISALGSGFAEGAVVIILQLMIPFSLLLYYVHSNIVGDKVALGTREMLFAVLCYYLYKVARDTVGNFLNVVGVYDTVSSRLRSLRKIVWDNGTDTISQSLGYSFDLFMNTGYICLLYIFNIFVLFNISDPFEILGSLLFFEFLDDLDEDIARSAWWDADKRYIRAGVVGLILQSTVEQTASGTKKAFVKKFSSSMSKQHEKVFIKNIEEKQLPDGSSFLRAHESDQKIQLLTIQEEVEMIREQEKVRVLGEEYRDQKERVSFGGILSSGAPIFERHERFRAWSQWEEVLFCCPTPTLVPRSYKEGTKLQLIDSDLKFTDGKNIHRVSYCSQLNLKLLKGKEDRIALFENWLAKVMNRKSRLTQGRGMFAQILQVVSYFMSSFINIFRKKVKGDYFTRIFFAILNLVSVLVQIIFPFLVIAALLTVYIKAAYCRLNLSFLSMEECSIEPYPP